MPRAARLAMLLAALAATAGWTAEAAAQTTFRGTVRYEKVLPGKKGLDLARPVPRPAAGIRVQVLSSPGRGILGSAFTDSAGAYSIDVPRPVEGAVTIRALAQTENTRVTRVRDRLEWSTSSEPFTPGRARTVRRDVMARDSGRVAGAFNIAMVIARANALVRSADPAIKLPRLQVRWDTLHARGTYFDEEDGVAYVNGLRTRDSDEYDDHVIAHEYGHFLLSSFSRDDSPAGEHSSGDELDPRLAWSEGWANFFAAAVAQNPEYVDTGARGASQTVLLSMDMEQDVEDEGRPGIWSEHAVSSVLWDWYDEPADGADSLALGFAPLWTAATAMRGQPDNYLLRFANL
ncbi:ImmA/IrrE family metallo-endopeptidase, partial [Longimicrobium sp.]|uniref:ImmA/IrrE family metallo-endopeptidase n=1 Tax=Longimicrobium sp. TaxID=2029185 RepID=UPI002EDB9942